MVLVHACSAPGAASQCFAYVIPVAPATVIATARARGRAVSESGRRGSNPRPSAWEADALPTELRPRSVQPYPSTRTASGVPDAVTRPWSTRRARCLATEALPQAARGDTLGRSLANRAGGDSITGRQH